MNTINVSPHKAALAGKSLDRLVEAVEGKVLLPSDAGYDAEVVGFNLAESSRPAVVVVAANAADVEAVVRFAASNQLPIAIRNTGHGAVACDGAVLIKTGLLSASHVDPGRRTARAQAGVRWQQVIADAGVFGLAPLNGSSPTVGVVGYTLGGGLGPIARQYGLAADHVLSIDLVGADGTLRQVTRRSDPDLFWAVLGTRGNFGVVTALEFSVFPVPRLYGGGLYFAGKHAADLIRVWRSWVETVPDAMTSSVALLRLPPLPELPEPLRGQFVVHVRIAYDGSAADGARLVEPLRSIAAPLIDSVEDMPYTAVGSIHADPPNPLPYYDGSILLRELSAEAAATVLRLGGPGVETPLTAIEIRHLGGALDRRGAHQVVDLAASRFSVFAIGVADAAGANVVRAAIRELLDDLRPWSSGRRYGNFFSVDETDPQIVQTAYEADIYDRLRSLKATYDPHNIFRINHNIPPMAPASGPRKSTSFSH